MIDTGPFETIIRDLMAENEKLRAAIKMILEYQKNSDLESIGLIAKTVSDRKQNGQRTHQQ